MIATWVPTWVGLSLMLGDTEIAIVVPVKLYHWRIQIQGCDAHGLVATEIGAKRAAEAEIRALHARLSAAVLAMEAQTCMQFSRDAETAVTVPSNGGSVAEARCKACRERMDGSV